MKYSFSSIVIFLVVTASAASCAALEPQPIQVTENNAQRLIERAAREGGEISLPAGRYEVTDLKIREDLNLAGIDEVVFFSATPVEKGLLNPLPGVSLRVENIKFEGAVSPDLNGAGIRHDGANLTVVNCIFENNENGILATGDESGAVLISASQFIGNGHGDGYSHGIYLSSGNILSVTDSRFIGTKEGHHIKSLAVRTDVLSSYFDGAQGGPSYAVDASRGGDVAILGNTIIQRATAGNATIINYDLARGGEPLGLRIENNHVVNFHPQGRFLRIDAPLEPVTAGNQIENKEGGRLAEN